MGSWNETCALSNLSIHDGEEVVLFVLEARSPKFIDLTDAIQELWTPVGLPLYGTYNDYGSINPDPAYAEYHETVLRVLTRDGKYGKTFEEFLYELERGNFKVGNKEHNWMLVKRSIWAPLIAEIGRDNHHGWDAEARKVIETPYYEHYRDALLTAAQKAAQVPTTFELDEDKMRQRIEADMDFQFFLERNLALNNGRMYAIKPFLMSDVATPQILANLLSLLLTNDLLHRLRKGWMPQFGSGSQDSELELTASLAKLTLGEIANIGSRFDEDEYLDTDED